MSLPAGSYIVRSIVLPEREEKIIFSSGIPERARYRAQMVNRGGRKNYGLKNKEETFNIVRTGRRTSVERRSANSAEYGRGLSVRPWASPDRGRARSCEFYESPA